MLPLFELYMVQSFKLLQADTDVGIWDFWVIKYCLVVYFA